MRYPKFSSFILFCLLQAFHLAGQDTLAKLLAKKDTAGYIDYVVNKQMADRELYSQETLYHHLTKSIEFAEKIKDTTKILFAKYALANFYDNFSDPWRAKKLLELIRLAESYPKKEGTQRLLAHAYSNYSNQESLPYDSAIYYLRKSIALHPVAKDTILLMLNYKNLALHYRVHRNLPDCIENGYEAVRISNYVPGFLQNVENHIHLADCLISSGRLEEAEAQMEQIRIWLSQMDYQKEHLIVLNVLRIVPRLYERLNQPREAYLFQKQYADLLESNLRQKWEGEIRKLQVAAKTQEKENEILALELRNHKAAQLRNQLLGGLGIVLLLIILLIIFYQFRQKYLSREAERLQDLDNFKTRLYTNITHEFRTPLTVILGMTKLVKEKPQEWLVEGVDAITRNGKQLLDLVNQMLDLSRLESGSMPLHLQQGNIIHFLSYLTQSFQSFAAFKNIQLHFNSEVNECIMDFDADKLTKVVSNLISNAVKYTPEGGHIKLEVRSIRYDTSNVFRASHLEFTVTDTGTGIPESQLPFIFDRFYQVDNSQTRKGEGTGIGLALTKEFVQLMQGTISVESQLDKRTTFTVSLPIKRTASSLVDSAFAAAQSVVDLSVAPEYIVENDAATDLPLALIIEDNRDVVQYLSACLKNQYQLEVAFDGAAGIEKAITMVPDIIISDVMMPEKDGFEVCATLKHDIRTSHIPIILLTAKADKASRIEGLEHGADVYLEKPFEKEELEVRLRKLIELRAHLRQKYQSADLEEVTPEKEPDQELLFLKQLETVIRTNITNEDFRVEPDLCRAMTMSRPQLYRKIKALKDQSPSEYVRSIRMQQARHLLLHTDLPIGDIAQQVGFKEHSYFTQVYHATFGETPLETRNS